MLNVALDKPALQSSTSRWSASRNPEDDARGGNNGIVAGDYGFHTHTEQNPWWQVDLQDDFVISRFTIYNRQHMAGRLKHFTVLTSLDGLTWTETFRKRDAAVFGERDGAPYVVDLPPTCIARFFRIRLDGHDALHFRECQVFGEPPDAATRERIAQQRAPAAPAKPAQPQERAGRVAKIGGFSVFVDTQTYAANIISSIDRGAYEARERELVKEIVRPDDRVIEAGTAIGVVAMTAAAIVGADNVATFDANPEIVGDARANFARNGLEKINARAGLLKNRRTMKDRDETAEFRISREFWSSRLAMPADHPDVVRTVRIPVFCLEDEILSLAATVLICDIEGAEVELLMQADLAGIRKIIMETHYWSAGEAATDAMVRKLVIDGFSIDLRRSANQVLLLRR